MTTALCILTLIAIPAAMWFLGLWNNVITFVNVVLAAIIATNFFEPMADRLDGGASSYTYLLDFVCLWLLFFFSFVVLRTLTDFLSKYRLQFNVWLDMAGRTVFSFATAWVFICFMVFTLHTAPLPVDSFQEFPDSTNFAGSPDRLWLGFMQSRSRGGMAAALNSPLMPEYNTGELHSDDQDLECRVFDSRSDYIYKYHERRARLSEQESLRVNR
ncbi:MAG: CvpA family protein [Pirellulaceae bacterium]